MVSHLSLSKPQVADLYNKDNNTEVLELLWSLDGVAEQPGVCQPSKVLRGIIRIPCASSGE